MLISLIAAVSENNVIGKDNDLLWHLPADIGYFKEMTMGHCVLMGRKNYESIPSRFRPLKGRNNIVVSRNHYDDNRDLHFVKSIRDGIDLAVKSKEGELFVIGGGEIYRQTIDQADKLYITRIHGEFEGDTYFPEIDGNIWKIASENFRKSDDRNAFDMTFLEYVKK